MIRALAAASAATLLGACAYGVSCTGAGCIEHRAHPLMHWTEPSARPPRMAENRRIDEVDCTRPLPEELVGNVRCR